jgi:hypothetical protein
MPRAAIEIDDEEGGAKGRRATQQADARGLAEILVDQAPLALVVGGLRHRAIKRDSSVFAKTLCAWPAIFTTARYTSFLFRLRCRMAVRENESEFIICLPRC